jgi:hypothetical protein
LLTLDENAAAWCCQWLTFLRLKSKMAVSINWDGFNILKKEYIWLFEYQIA